MKIIAAVHGLVKEHLFSFWPFPVGDEKNALVVLNQSGVWDKSYYRDQLGFFANIFAFRSDLHFLRSACKTGYSPSRYFDTRWYLEQYPDVAKTNINPLLHFIKFGIYENRKPLSSGGLGQFAQVVNSPMGYYWLAWRGFQALGIKKLLDAAAAGNDDAYWYLAMWHYAQGNIQIAYEQLQKLARSEVSSFKPKAVPCLAQCRLQLDHVSADEKALQFDQVDLTTLNADLLALSDKSLSMGQRLLGINKHYIANDVAPLTYRNEQDALTIRSLKTKNVESTLDRRFKVSVILPVYNAEHTIDIALSCLLAQSWSNLEVVVVDDASTDATVKRVNQFMLQDARIKLIRHAENRGAYLARNTGMSHAVGDLLTVHDSDDWSHPEKIELQVKPFKQKSDTLATMSSWLRVDESLKVVGPWYLSANWLQPNPSSLMLRREVYQTLGEWDAVRVAGDIEYIERIKHFYGADAITSVLPNLPLAFALTHPSSLTQRKLTHVRSVQGGLRKVYRECAYWWHRRAPVPKLKNQAGLRAFPAPLGVLPNAQQSTCFDVLVLADGAVTGSHLKTLLKDLFQLCQMGHQLAFFAWSDANLLSSSEWSDDLLEFFQQENVTIVTADHVIEVKEVRVETPLSERELWPDQVPHLTTDSIPVLSLTGEAIEDASVNALRSLLYRPDASTT